MKIINLNTHQSMCVFEQDFHKNSLHKNSFLDLDVCYGMTLPLTPFLMLGASPSSP